ncbi:MAG TPA: Fis family transcriptional regulator [Pseudomonas sp.]|nr:Fis family transcriptional regulator [Pseudomonas sp.]
MSSDNRIDDGTQVVLIDDDPHLRKALSQTLDLAGLKVACLEDARTLEARLPADWHGVVVSDIRMPGIDGLQLLANLQGRDADLPVLLITGHGDVQLAVQAMRAGAYDFLEKPFPSEALLDSVRRALALRRLVLDNRSLRLALADRQQLAGRLLGHSPAMARLREQIGALAGTQADVLILGETGAGKEVVARALHDLSARRDGPFVAINPGALAASVVESELFGYAPGTFTGARSKGMRGLIQQADKGTLFLDEIGDMPLHLQTRLLRVLAEQEVTPLGAEQPVKVDIRVIAASHRDLRQMVEAGAFREDLFYRLNGALLKLPPLRERADKGYLIERVYAELAQGRSNAPHLRGDAMSALLAYPWPGNIRELRNVLQYALATCEGAEITVHDLPEECLPRTLARHEPPALEQGPDEALRSLLRRQRWNVSAVARELGVSRPTVYRRMRVLGIEPPV